jgi:hypothetical protein
VPALHRERLNIRTSTKCCFICRVRVSRSPPSHALMFGPEQLHRHRQGAERLEERATFPDAWYAVQQAEPLARCEIDCRPSLVALSSADEGFHSSDRHRFVGRGRKMAT